jgi:hypothetical protein
MIPGVSLYGLVRLSGILLSGAAVAQQRADKIPASADCA